MSQPRKTKPRSLNQSTTIDEAIAELEKMLHPEFIDGLALWIRNNWGLWHDNPLTECLRLVGAAHPDVELFAHRPVASSTTG